MVGTVDIEEPTKIRIYVNNAPSSIRPSVPCHQMTQVYNSKAVGAEDAEFGTLVRWPVPNVILQIYSLNKVRPVRCQYGAPSALVCTLYIHVRHNENKHKEWKIWPRNTSFGETFVNVHISNSKMKIKRKPSKFWLCHQSPTRRRENHPPIWVKRVEYYCCQGIVSRPDFTILGHCSALGPQCTVVKIPGQRSETKTIARKRVSQQHVKYDSIVNESSWRIIRDLE